MCAPRPTLKLALKFYHNTNLLFAEVVATLTHADAPHRGNALHRAPRSACVYHALQ
jgi:hypothetical protein